MTIPTTQRELLTPAEVAQMFRVDPKTVTRWARAGKLASIRTIGGHRRYDAVEVRALLAGAPAPVVDYPAAVRERDGMAGHTVTVERLETGRLAAVERHGGTFISTRYVAADGEASQTTEQIAELAAGILGAKYVTLAPATAAEPVEARPAHRYPFTIPVRDGMTGHTMSVERLADDCATAYGAPSRDLSGRLAVVERTDGRFGTLPAIGEENATSADMEELAATIAATYGARHVRVEVSR